MITATGIPAPAKAVEQQTPAVRHCLHLIARVFDVNPGFDVPCGCGHRSDLCTMDENGLCGG